MAAPERSDLVPMSAAVYPNASFPPIRVHVERSALRSDMLDTRHTLVLRHMELSGVSGEACGIRRWMRATSDASRRTGHSTGSLVRWCVLLSILVPFF